MMFLHAFLQCSPYLQNLTGYKSTGFVAHDVSTCLPPMFSLPTISNWWQKHGLLCSWCFCMPSSKVLLTYLTGINHAVRQPACIWAFPPEGGNETIAGEPTPSSLPLQYTHNIHSLFLFLFLSLPLILSLSLLFVLFFLFLFTSFSQKSLYTTKIQHCFICSPSDSTVSEHAGIEPKTFATFSHSQSDALTTRLDLTHNSARSHPH